MRRRNSHSASVVASRHWAQSLVDVRIVRVSVANSTNVNIRLRAGTGKRRSTRKWDKGYSRKNETSSLTNQKSMRIIKQPPDIAFQTRRQRPSATHTLRHQEEGAERHSQTKPLCVSAVFTMRQCSKSLLLFPQNTNRFDGRATNCDGHAE